LARASTETGVTVTTTDHRALVDRDDVHAVLIATPNASHPPIALAAIAAGKHVLCEKPIALTTADAVAMAIAADHADVRHMTAFTYRFVPALRYAASIVGDLGNPYHFRAQRFQDWGDRPLGWRQQKLLAGTGELADMLSHRIDYGHVLVGPFKRVVADVRTFVPQRGGQPSDVDDWVAVLGDMGGATAMLESTKLATGRGENHRGQDVVEVNGPAGTIVYSTQSPLTLRIGKPGDVDLHAVDVPREFHVWPGSDRDPSVGDPLATFRYDQDVEFINAIREGRPCRPTFWDGAAVQSVMDAIVMSAEGKRWVDVTQVSP
jgi:predicted dehydrogenase